MRQPWLLRRRVIAYGGDARRNTGLREPFRREGNESAGLRCEKRAMSRESLADAAVEFARLRIAHR